MVMNDLSARDRNPRQDWHFFTDWFAGKCFDGFAPMGPGIVPSRFVSDPQDLPLKLWVNDTLMQDSNTSFMLFNIHELIEFASEICTLEPGDVIATGTPAGVGRPRGIFLNSGDVVTATIEGLGTLRNKMV
jgi:2-keto-4-pentenoate hydratase/2-oxohepta-3-ene-1,7-dioic acid hydratase in catechol pathway